MVILSDVDANTFESNYKYAIQSRIYEKFGVFLRSSTVSPKVDQLAEFGYLKREYFLYRITPEGRRFLDRGRNELNLITEFYRTGTVNQDSNINLS